jgi:predicted dehydrogenase
MTSFKNAIAAVAALVLVSPAIAQTGRVSFNAGAQQENSVRVQIGINMFLAGPTGDGDEAQKLRDKAQRVVYDMAGHECDLLRDALAKDCRLESVNVNVNANARQYNQQQPEGMSVNGSISVQITLK